MKVDEYKQLISEETEQIHLMTWCRWAESKYPELSAVYHIPNEGKRSKAAGGRLKEMGLRPGVPDICLPVPKGGYSGLYIELKKIGGKPTASQIDWLELLDSYGHCVAVCEGAEAAEALIIAYCERNSDKTEKLRLSSERGDFDRLRTPKTSPKRRYGNAYIAAVLIQIAVMAADLSINATVTGRSLVPFYIVLVIGLTAKYTSDRYNKN